MCGLAGFISKSITYEASSKEIISQMLSLQAHRGPDDSGINFCSISEDYELVIGFNRLSILDLTENGHQPMIDDQTGVVLMLNGEIYNAFDYKDILIKKGYQFKSNTDTEIVLNLYLEFGFDSMITMLNGMFAIEIYDKNIGKLYLARDRFGIKPLYILKNNQYFSFSSEIKSFKALPNFIFQLDESGLDEYLLFRNRVNNTLFKDIVNLQQGCYLELDSNLNESLHTYYNVNNEGQKNDSNKDNEIILESTLEKSIKRQLLSDVKLGCQLSGGVDSSLVTYFASKMQEKGQLETISIVFDDPKFSEKQYIDELSNKLSLLSHQYILDGKQFTTYLEEASWYFEQPINHPNTLGIYELSKHAKKHVTVLLSGEGADEIFGGYDRFWLNKDFIFQLKNCYKNKNSFFQFVKLIKSEAGRIVLSGSFGSIESAKQIYKKFDINKAVQKRMVYYKQLTGDVFLKQRKYEISMFIPDLLMRQDKMSMAWSIENRVPFLDNELVSLALKIPKKSLLQKIGGKIEGKFLLKEICANKINRNFAFRKKMGFTIPLKQFLAEPDFEKKWNTEILPKIKTRNIFNADMAENLYNNLPKLKPDQLDSLWLMISFEIWAKQYSI